MKLQELLKEREILRKYDELQEWKGHFGKDELYLHSACAFFGADEALSVFIPSHIREIIVNALQSEIDKLEKE